MQLTEDDIYRSSTQYRHWSFTPERLASQRQDTNLQASKRVKAAIARRERVEQDNSTTSSEDKQETASSHEGSPSPLVSFTVAQEKNIVDVLSEVALEFGEFCKFPVEVNATGVQYLRRFYLSNSPMLYDPQMLFKCTMFIATKVEGYHISADEYCENLPKTTPKTLLASEGLILQSLHFNLLVKHPFRGLKGGQFELLELAHGNGSLIAGNDQTPTQIQQAMLNLPRVVDGPATDLTIAELTQRISEAYGSAKKCLETSAQLTDAYFLYTSSQIWLSAHLLADEPLTLFYLSTKISPSSPLYLKILATLRSCASLFSSHWSHTHMTKEDKAKRRKEAAALIKKIEKLKKDTDLEFKDLH